MKKWQKWLQSVVACTMCACIFVGCSPKSGGGNSSSSSEVVDDGIYTVTFELCTDLKTNKILDKEVEKGETITKPIVGVIGDNPNNSEVDGWYTDPEYTDEWNFLTDTVERDMTLYAKWLDKYTVNYYLGDELETPMFSELIKAGDKVSEDRKSFADGYDSNGLFLDPDYKEKYDFDKPVTANMNIYIHRSDEFYFSPKMIAERFTPVAAGGGANGAEAGTLEYVEDGDNSYAKVNFGYVPEDTTPDPHINLTSVKVDITSSQKVRIRMKNMGPSETMRIYYVIRYENDDPVHAPFYNETCAFTYRFAENERNMTAEDEWLDLVLDFAGGTEENSGIVNGVSLWGNASYLNQMRLQSTCHSPDKENLNNEFWIQSIQGIADDKFVDTSDTEAVSEMLQDDDADAVKQVADKQADVAGWVFPKDNEDVVGTMNRYNKEEGLLAYAPYRAKDAKMIFNLSEDQENGYEKIDLNVLTTMKIRLRNYGYATSFKLKYITTDGSNEIEVAISTRDTETMEYKLNMFGARRWTGELQAMEITYTSVGVDNAILFEGILFDEYEAIQVPGFNFNDKYCFGATSNDAMKATYDDVAKGTNFEIIDAANAFVERTYTTSFPIVGYKTLTVNYIMAEAGVTAVKVALTVDGEEKVYSFPVSTDKTSVSVDLLKTGNVEKVKVSFEGTGKILIQDILFGVDQYSMDFSKIGTWNALVSDWGKTTTFDTNTNSILYSQYGSPAVVKYYYGYSLEYLHTGTGNVPLEGKSKVVFVYQNLGAEVHMNFAIGLTDKTEGDDWKLVHTESNTTGGGSLVAQKLQGNMSENEWACVEFDLFSGNGNKDNSFNAETAADKALTMFMLQFTDPSAKATIRIRAIIIA